MIERKKLHTLYWTEEKFKLIYKIFKYKMDTRKKLSFYRLKGKLYTQLDFK